MGKIKIECTEKQKDALLKTLLVQEWGCPFPNECPVGGCEQCIEENLDFTIIKEDKA